MEISDPDERRYLVDIIRGIDINYMKDKEKKAKAANKREDRKISNKKS